MITEIALISPLTVLWYFNILGLWMICCIMAVFYWIPKYIISLAEYFFPKVIFRKNNVFKKVCLTFDDVPYDTTTYKEIIYVLDSFNVKATFFIISSQITNESKKILINAVKNGHHLGNHGHTNTMHALLSESLLVGELIYCDTMIKDIYNLANVPLPNTLLYRPGCGIFTNRMIDIMESCDTRYAMCLGSVYPNDPIVRSSLINYYYLINHIDSGDIIILHDRKWTVPLLQNLLTWMMKHNYDVVI